MDWHYVTVLKGQGRYLGGVGWVYRYSTEVYTFWDGLVAEFVENFVEICEKRLDFPLVDMGNQRNLS